MLYSYSGTTFGRLFLNLDVCVTMVSCTLSQGDKNVIMVAIITRKHCDLKWHYLNSPIVVVRIIVIFCFIPSTLYLL